MGRLGLKIFSGMSKEEYVRLIGSKVWWKLLIEYFILFLNFSTYACRLFFWNYTYLDCCTDEFVHLDLLRHFRYLDISIDTFIHFIFYLRHTLDLVTITTSTSILTTKELNWKNLHKTRNILKENLISCLRYAQNWVLVDF